MAKKAEKSLVVGLDIGTSKIVAIVGEGQPDGTVEVIGIGSHPSTGLKRGVVVDMASTEQAIQRAVEEAELMAGCEINSVYTGIAGSRGYQIETIINLLPQGHATTVVQPTVHFLGRQTIRYRSKKLGRLGFAFPVIGRTMPHFSSPAGHSIKYLKGRNQLLRTINLDA